MYVARPADKSAIRDALAVLVSRPGLSSAELDEQIDVLLRYVERRQLSLDHCLMAQQRGRVIGVCLCVDAPGRTSSVFIPATSDAPEVAEAVLCLLEESARLAAGRRVQVLQGTVHPTAKHEGQLLARAGFQWLAELAYLDSDLTNPVLAGKSTPALAWQAYSQATHSLFCGVVQKTYADSLDCVGLNGIRDIEDILAGHRGTGEFDPDLWLVGIVGSEPVGVLLLAYIPERWAYEVVYMGVLPAWRARGYGSALLTKAIELARDRAVTTLTLAVDTRNAPARRLYDHFGFVEASRRDVWIRLLGPGVSTGPGDSDACS